MSRIAVVYSLAVHVNEELSLQNADKTAGERHITMYFRLDDDDPVCAPIFYFFLLE